MKMSYQSGDRLKNRYLSNDAFTSLKNKLGGRSITSLGNNRKRNSYKVANQGFDMLDYKTVIYRLFVIFLLALMLVYIIPQTRYFVHGFVAQKADEPQSASRKMLAESAYDIAPVFLKTDEFVARQKETEVVDGAYAYDFFTENLVGVAMENSSSTIRIKLFSDAGFKNNFLIEQGDIVEPDANAIVDTTDDSEFLSTTSTTTEDITDIPETEIVQENDSTYQSYVFEGLGYGQLIARVPPKTEVKKDTLIYVKTLDGLKPVAKIINVDEDNKSTFTIVSAQLIVSPQNLYKIIFK